MINVVYSAFSFLQKKLNRNHDQCYNVKQTVPKGSTVVDLIVAIGLKSKDVEAAFINGKVNRLSTPLNDGDRVALLPPGTPGPYRVILGIKDSK